MTKRSTTRSSAKSTAGSRRTARKLKLVSHRSGGRQQEKTKARRASGVGRKSAPRAGSRTHRSPVRAAKIESVW